MKSLVDRLYAGETVTVRPAYLYSKYFFRQIYRKGVVDKKIARKLKKFITNSRNGRLSSYLNFARECGIITWIIGNVHGRCFKETPEQIFTKERLSVFIQEQEEAFAFIPVYERRRLINKTRAISGLKIVSLLDRSGIIWLNICMEETDSLYSPTRLTNKVYLELKLKGLKNE